MNLKRKKKSKRKKKRTFLNYFTDHEKVREKIIAIQAKRQDVINTVHASLKTRVVERESLKNTIQKRELNILKKDRKYARKSEIEQMMHKIRKDLNEIIEAGIKGVSPLEIVSKKIKLDGNSTLTVEGRKYNIKNNLHLVGWGREALGMSITFEKIVEKHLKKGFVIVPRKSISMMWNFPEAFPKLNSSITYIEAGETNGQPDKDSAEANRKILNYCKKLKEKDILVVMVSEKMDNLLCCPGENILLRDQLKLFERLKANNATLNEIDTVMTKLSGIQGGDLARAAYPAKIILLMSSDKSIANNLCTYQIKDATAYKILIKYKLADKIPQSVRELLQKNLSENSKADAYLDENKEYEFIDKYIIARNSDAIDSMAIETFKFGLFPIKLSSCLTNNVKTFALEYVKLTSLIILGVEGKIDELHMYNEMKDSSVCPLTDRQVHEIFPSKEKWGLGLCLLFGGKPIVDLISHSPGIGGPNQELALYFATYWSETTKRCPILNQYNVWFLGANSNGKDGNSDVAGAYGYPSINTEILHQYGNVKNSYEIALSEWREMVEAERDEPETMEMLKKVKNLRHLCGEYETMLPNRVLRENNSTFTFERINDGDELYRLDISNYFSAVNLGNLYVIRIVESQCTCDNKGGDDNLKYFHN